MRKRKTKRLLSYLLALVLMFGNVQGLSVLAAEENVGMETELPQESEISEEIVVPEESVPDVEKEESSKQESEENLKAETSVGNKKENSAKEEKAETQKAKTKEIPVKTEGPTMKITDEDLQNNSYEIYYHVEDITYTYNGNIVTFISDTEFIAGGQTYSLKNQAVKVTVQETEDGTISVTLDGVKGPVGAISGAWNSQFGGSVQLVYQTDIPGMEEIRSAEGTPLKNVIELKGLDNGIYHLTEGTIYEKANEFSPGYDFGDGKGVVKEGFFGTLPDITLVIEGEEPQPEPEPQPASARLKSLEVIGGTIEPAFHPDTLSYTLKVPHGTKTVTMNMEVESEGASIAITNTADPLSPGKPGSPLVVEDGKRISVMVMNGTLFKSYGFLIKEEEGEIPPEEPKDKYLGVKTEAKVYDDFENDIWLQYQQKEMKVGDKADLYPWRVPQIVSDTIENDVFRPDFHFEIISGDSVKLDKTESDQKAIVIAEKPGTSIVKVTYDASEYSGKNWGAISDVNTAYAVFTVGENGKATIRTDEEFENWQHYDTIYYMEGTTVPYTFTVNTENAKSVRVTVNGLPIEGNGNQYTANLENRSNIIGIEAKDEDENVTSMYRVIDARFMEVVVENKTNQGQELKAGDTANVSFRGITMPVHKLATIYNPVFGKNVTRVLYENDELGLFEGKCSQWDLATNNDFDVTFVEEGTYNFYSEEGIRCTWWGDDLGADMVKQGVGAPNLKANDIIGYFSVLPDFTIEVAGDETENPNPKPEEPDKPAEPEQEPTEEDLPEFPTVDPSDKEDGKGEGSSGISGSKVNNSSGGSVKRVSRKTSKTTSNTVKITVEKHLVDKEEVEKIKGKDKNLQMIDSFENGTKYSMILNGKEIKNASDINTAIRKESVYEEEIKLLAPEPEILVFEHEGEFPGKVLVELEVEKEDGTYLLFQYDNMEKKAVYVQKIEVKEGKTRFFISEGGDYFIDTKAKVKSVDELTEDEANEWEEAAEEDVLEVREVKEEKDYSMLLVGILIGLGVAGVFGAGFVIGRKRR